MDVVYVWSRVEIMYKVNRCEKMSISLIGFYLRFVLSDMDDLLYNGL